MKTVRKLILVISALMGIWVLASFVGVMFNLSNAEFWTRSLMWGLLASVFVMPALVVAFHASTRFERRKTERQVQQSAPSLQEQPPFIEEEEQAPLWPEAETNWPEPEGDRSSKG